MIEAAIILFLLALLAVWVSLPLVPAIMIYRRFPDTKVAASGPLANLTVKASGAFAAYLLVFLVVAPLVYTIREVIGSELRTFWEIRGQVNLIDEKGNPVRGVDQQIAAMILGDFPKSLDHDGIDLTLKLPEQRDGTLPKIVISVPNWGKADVRLDEQPWYERWLHRDRFFKTITIGKVDIRKVPIPKAYDSRSPMDPG